MVGVASTFATVKPRHVGRHGSCAAPRDGWRFTDGKRGADILKSAVAEVEADEFSSRSMNLDEPVCECLLVTTEVGASEKTGCPAWLRLVLGKREPLRLMIFLTDAFHT